MSDWTPSPELLAAFADGELAQRDDAEMRARIEQWLADHPHAQAELLGNRRLKALFARTAPPAPSAETWSQVIDRIEDRPTAHRSTSPGWFVGMAAVAACVVWAVLLFSNYGRTPLEVFAVATDRDVEILHVEGKAIDNLIVGTLPLNGVLELAESGEVDGPMDGQGRPMIRRAKLENEND